MYQKFISAEVKVKNINYYCHHYHFMFESVIESFEKLLGKGGHDYICRNTISE
jgi:hypothetical protein